MSNIQQQPDQRHWSKLHIILFRIVFIFFLLLTIPLDGQYYSRLFSIHLFNLHFQDLFQITNDVPRLIHIADWGIASYAGWGIALIAGIIGALIWGLVEKNSSDQKYNELYYWLRVVIRFRVAIGLIGYGVIKLFPVQIPYPTLSDLHTAYGDFLPWKIYYLSTGAGRAGYEQTLGALEILAGLLLVYRRTVVIGAGIAIALLTNIVLVNFAYQLGQHVYSLYLLLASVFLIIYDVPRLYTLLVKEKLAIADNFEPVHQFKKLKYSLKTLLWFFLFIYTSLTFAGYKNSRWPYPDTPGLANAYGVYNVREFKLNNKILPYSATDTTRWQNVVFERWNVLSIRANKNYPIDLTSPELDYQANDQRSYESKGNGGRSFYRYITTNNTIRLNNEHIPADKFVFRISRPDSLTIVLEGINSKKDSLHIILDKLAKKYLLYKGRRKTIFLN